MTRPPTPAEPGRHRLPREFFDRPVLTVAPALLGCVIHHGGVSVRLTEVEAYHGREDPGSHAYRGPTPRTEVMFGEPGGLYVYFTYGMHYCANVVCEPSGVAAAVLLRAGEVIAGLPEATDRRTGGGVRSVRPRDLARGPARLTQALGLGREHNGTMITRTGSPVWISGPEREVDWPQSPTYRQGPRVGVAGPGGDPVAFPWRFWLDGEPTVSPFRAGGVRRRRGSPVTARTDGLGPHTEPRG